MASGLTGISVSYTTGLSIIIGLGDGLIVPFAVSAGIAQIPGYALTTGFAGLLLAFGGAVVMGLGGYYSINTIQQDAEQKYREERHTDRILANLDMEEYIGREAEHEHEAVEEAKARALEQTLRQQDLYIKNAGLFALVIGLAYLIGGVLVVLPYFFLSDVSQALLYSALITFVALVITGGIRSRFIGKKPMETIVRLLITAGLTAGGTFLLATLFFS